VSEEVEEAAKAPRRKSPTTVTRSESLGDRRGFSTYAPLGVLLASVLVAVLIGYSDKGQIDIQAIAAGQVQQTTTDGGGEDGEDTTITIPVQNNSSLPSGGLTPSADQSAPTPPLPVLEDNASSTATSSEDGTENATSTELSTVSVEEGGSIEESGLAPEER